MELEKTDFPFGNSPLIGSPLSKGFLMYFDKDFLAIVSTCTIVWPNLPNLEILSTHLKKVSMTKANNIKVIKKRKNLPA